MALKTWLTGVAMCLALLQVGLARATKTEKIVKADNRADFSGMVTKVQQDMQPGGRYGFIDDKERDSVNQGLAYMQSLFDKYDTVGAMSPAAKIDLFNHQEVVNAILTKRDNERLVCESVAPVGSHIPRTTCRTYGLIEQERRDTQNAMDNFKAQRKFKSGN